MTEYKGFTSCAKDWLRPEEQTVGPFPPGYEELAVALADFRQEMSVTTAAQNPNDKRWARRIINSLTPGKQEISSARRALVAYWESLDISTLDTAISHFHKAGARRQREARTLAFGFFLDALDRYESSGHKQEDLLRTIRTGNEARDLWSNGTNPGVYGVILYNIATTHQHLYDQSIANRKSNGSESGAFELAKKYFLEVINNKHVGDLRLLSHMQLGILIMTQCVHENTVSGLELCIEHWERALTELNSPRADVGPASTKETESAKLITEGRTIQKTGITYQLGIAYQLQYREDLDRDSRLHNLNKSIHYFEKAQVLFEDMKTPAFSSSRVMFALATRFVLRWELTTKQSDLERAKALLKTAQTVEIDDEELKQKITRVLTALEGEVGSH